MHREIEAGFSAVSDAGHVLRAKATPCRMLEAWALGDRAAIEHLGGSVKDIPTRPETLSGDEGDPSSNHPKCVLKRVVRGDMNAERFQSLAEESRPDTLKKTCPESFAPFAKEMERAATQLKKRADR